MLILEPGDVLSTILRSVSVPLCCRLISNLLSGSLPTCPSPPPGVLWRAPRGGSDFLETRPAPFSTILVISVLSSLLRAPLEVRSEGAAVPPNDLLLTGLVESAGDFLVLIMLSILKLLLEVIRLPELPTDGFCASGRAGFLVPIMLPILQLLLELIRLSELTAGGLCVAGTPGFCVLTILPIRDPILELIRSLTLPTDDCCVSGALDFCVLIILPMRVLILESIRLLELPTGGFCVLETSGFVVVIGLAMREVMLEFMRLSEFTIGCLAIPGFSTVGCLMPRGLLEGLRSEEEIPVRMVEGRLSVISPG